MATVFKDKVYNRLKAQWDYLLHQETNENQLLGIFLYGSQNYNFGNESSDVDSRAIIIPTFNDLCLRSKPLSRTCQIPVKSRFECIDMKDLRIMKDNFMKQNISFIECLYTDYYIINPKYKNLYEYYFLEHRDAISHMDRVRTIKNAYGQLANYLAAGPTDNKKLYNANRLYIFLRNYIANMPYERCIRPEGTEWAALWQLKYEQSEFSRSKMAKLENAAKLRTLSKKIVEDNSDLDSPLKEEAITNLNTGVVEIMRTACSESFSDQAISREKFLRSLTVNETKAYYSVIKETHEEGVISITKMLTEYPFSRQVYNNLFSKMRQYEVAKVESMGVKGTYVKITEPALQAEAMNYKGEDITNEELYN